MSLFSLLFSSLSLCFSSVSGHAPDCTCTQRRYVSGIDTSSVEGGGDYNDAVEEFDDRDLQKTGPIPYGGYGYGNQGSSAYQPYGGGGHSRTRHGLPPLDDDEDSENEYFHTDEPTANNLTEQQIQDLIQQQVARLNARLNELDEELAAEEEDAELEAERQEREIMAAAAAAQQKKQKRDRSKPAAAIMK